MVESCDGLRLSAESSNVAEGSAAHELQSDHAFQLAVARLLHDSHPATRHLAPDFVSPNLHARPLE